MKTTNGILPNHIKNYIKNTKILRLSAITSAFTLSLLCLHIILPPSLHGAGIIDTASATSSYTKLVTTLTLTTESNIAGVNLLVKDNSGTFASSDNSGSTLGFNVSTTNLTGYTLSIVSPSDTTYNNGKLTNTDATNCTDPTKCVLNTISSASNTISTNGTWGYKPSKLNSVENTNYLPSPTTTPTILDETDSPNTTPNPYTISIGAKADYTQPAGVYSNTYTLQATGNIVVIYMQDVTKEDMQALLPDVGDAMTLYDKRDNQAYTVGKLADGNHWLLDNLALDLTDPSVQANLSSSTTNATDVELNYLINGGGTASDQYAMSGVANWTSTGNSYSDPWIAVNNPGKIGGYYNFCAASAGSYCYGDGTSAGDLSLLPDITTSDICPAGWRMPTGISYGEYWDLFAVYYNHDSFRNALQLPFSGAFARGEAANQDFMGYFWASVFFDGLVVTANDTHSMYDEFGAEPINDPRDLGFSVRCIIKPTYTVQFDPNGGTGTMGDQTMPTHQAATLNSNTFINGDYVFTGWNTQADGTGTSYADGASVTDLAASGGSITLYAQWKIYLQDLTLSTCQKNVGLNGNGANIGDTITAYDRRDGSGYTVRYINGACWMMQNLNLGSSTLSTDLDSTNTNLASDTTVAAATFNGWIKSSGTGTYTSAELIPVSGSDSYGNPYGTLYNYCAASAGTYCMASSTTDATQDLCPAGWRLPTGGPSGEFQALATAYSIDDSATGSTKLQETLTFPLAGYFVNSTPLKQGSWGNYWSSTRFDDGGVYVLDFDTSHVYTANYGYRGLGRSVRCVRTS